MAVRTDARRGQGQADMCENRGRGGILCMPAGRPTLYKPEYAEQVYKLCLLGATDKDIAEFFGVTEQTVNNWKIEYPEFFESIKKGKLEADAEIAKSLHHRAKGYSHPDVHVSNYQGEITVTPLIRHYPPDTAAAIIWLKNRQPDKWRDRQSTDTNLTISLTIDAQDRRNRIAELLKRQLQDAIEIEDYQIMPEDDA